MGLFDKFKDASSKFTETSSLTAEEKEARKLAKVELKAQIRLEQSVKFIAGRELVGATGLFGDKMYQLNNADVIFNLDTPTYFRITRLEFAGPVYHEEQKTESQSDTKTNSKTKKHRHGLGGAVIGTMLAPGIGTLAGAVIGGQSGKDKTKGQSSTQASGSVITSQVEDDSSTIVYLVNKETGEKLQIALSTKTADYQRLQSFKLDEPAQSIESPDPAIAEEKVAPENIAAPVNDPVAELKKYKGLLDEGIITQEEFDTKKKQLLDL
ncbi:SHOCT domain-containing protein [Lacticaseibacillus rhamnosus]